MERADLLAELEALSDAKHAKHSDDASLDSLRWEVETLRKAADKVRAYGHLGAVWLDDGEASTA